MSKRGDKNGRKGCGSAVVFERLEERQHFSAVLPATAGLATGHQVVSKAIVVHAMPRKAAAPVQRFAQLTGDWSGTFSVNNSAKTGPVAIRAISQSGEAAVADFDFRALAGGKSRGVLILDVNRNVRSLFNGKFQGGFTGAVSSNGKMITVRWAFNTAKGWITGIMTLTKK